MGMDFQQIMHPVLRASKKVSVSCWWGCLLGQLLKASIASGNIELSAASSAASPVTL